MQFLALSVRTPYVRPTQTVIHVCSVIGERRVKSTLNAKKITAFQLVVDKDKVLSIH